MQSLKILWIGTLRGWCVATFIVSYQVAAAQQAVPVLVGEPVKVVGRFAAPDTDAKKPRGISGVACLPLKNGQRDCLAINDEERFAEWATLQGMTLTPSGRKVMLLSQPTAQAENIVGSMPEETHCPKRGDFKEFDGEAIAIDGDWFYVVGSHACGRNSGKFKPSTFIFSRGRADGQGLAAASVERSWRLADVIRNSPLKDAFARPGPEGVGIEGMAVIKDRVYLGLRTPVLDGKATILHTPIAPIFAPGTQKLSAKPELISLALGADVGIRDLAALPDGRLLVLSGPTEAGPVPYIVHLLSLKDGRLRPLAELRSKVAGQIDPKQPAKAEAMTVLSVADNTLTLLVGYDDLDDGGFRLYRLTLPQ